jgi:Tol biopolymer transport system component/DNA-binding winged helix-turn-helix (wHTH) protein
VETREGSTQRWRFGIFEVDARRSELRRSGTLVKLREQSFRILVLLLERAGDLVTREELRQALWPSDTYVDFDHSLNTAVMKLRDALGDSADKPLYIETIPKRGYRFVAPLFQPGDFPGEVLATDTKTVAPQTTPTLNTALLTVPVEPPMRRHFIGYTVAALCLLLFVTIGAIVFLSSRARDKASTTQPLRMIHITTAAGNAISPVFSPDGREIAFVWDGPDRQHYDLYLQLIGAEPPLRLTRNPGGLLGRPAWSPDGTQIAFSRCGGSNDGVYVLPALGGAERKLTEVGCPYSLPHPVVWLSGGQQMLMIDRCSPGGPFGVVSFSLATGDKRCLVTTSATSTEINFGFSLSPDGRTIATHSLCCGINAVPLSGGTPKRISDDRVGCDTYSDFDCTGLMWLPDSESIVFSSHRAALFSLWRVSAAGGTVEPETTYPAIGNFSKDGRSFVYSEESSSEPPAIWRAELGAAGGPVTSNKSLIKSQYTEYDAQPSPDGDRIVWASNRTGRAELWLSDKDGEHPVQLTHLERYSGTPRWAPDGKNIVFDSVEFRYSKGSPQIFVIDTEGRNLRQITSGAYDNVVPSWSRDGRFIYFASKRTGNWQLWKHRLDNGAETQMTQHGGFTGFESSDGRTLYFSKFDQAGIWSIPASGGAESLVVPDKPGIGFWGHWAVTESGLYLLDTEAEPRASIVFYRFATGRLSHVLTLEKKAARLQPSLSATADGKTVYYTQYDRQSVIKLIEFAR